MTNTNLPSCSNVRNISGDVFGRLCVISSAPIIVPGDNCRIKKWECRCVCGVRIFVQCSDLTSGRQISCGCFRREQSKSRKLIHGLEGSPTYQSWCNMIQRCTNVNHPDYPAYGLIGISVCQRWRIFTNFLDDMGERPVDKLSLDRFPNNAGNYEPGNVRWATALEQSRNKRNNLLVEFRGETRLLKDWEAIVGIPYDILRYRIFRRGWAIEKAMTEPFDKRKRHH